MKNITISLEKVLGSFCKLFRLIIPLNCEELWSVLQHSSASEWRALHFRSHPATSFSIYIIGVLDYRLCELSNEQSTANCEHWHPLTLNADVQPILVLLKRLCHCCAVYLWSGCLEGKSQITPHMHSLIYVALFVFRRFIFKIKQIFFWESVAESEVHWNLGVSLKSPAGFQPVTHQMTDKLCSTCAMLPSNGDMLKKEKKARQKLTQWMNSVTALKNSRLYFLMVVFTGGMACYLDTCGQKKTKKPPEKHISGRRSVTKFTNDIGIWTK